ncbi:hypothetical protein A2Y99_04705 [Candidatus Gottesmanbacteria bacterium RBG_13_37_7]|uniref:Dephospho-CoA kinase n=1 Tax=Candidatus Gottesmanbacteria bacterium RBG_13_37_7 TaxID=1798369 RepID=A0A1F5YIT2_9BACT|nr:MAG: hypothetical protein A2Y99_04705 [Candidatus Gottesmanbacteria bacterium RBG_13_37_7]
MTRVIIVVGKFGSGKTTTADFFKRKKIPVISMGQLTEEMLQILVYPVTEKEEKRVRNMLRQTYGLSVYARYAVQRLIRHTQDPLIIVEGMRSAEEYQYLKRRLKKIKILYLKTDQKLRIQRIRDRQIRNLTTKEVVLRNIEEKGLGIGRFEKIADYIINNSSGKEYLFGQLEKILSTID